MTRHLAVVALLALPAVGSAQVSTPVPPGTTVIVGPPMLGGRLVTGPPITNGPSALFPVQTAAPSRFGVGGGSMSGPPPLWLPSGDWGGVRYAWPVSPVLVLPAPVPVPAAGVRPAGVYPQTAPSGQAYATLVVQFPAAAEIWVDGKKRDGDPAAEWTLTSPPLKVGESHTFEVKGRWKTGGKTFETIRSVTVTAGDRSRSIIVSGTEVKE